MTCTVSHRAPGSARIGARRPVAQPAVPFAHNSDRWQTPSGRGDGRRPRRFRAGDDRVPTFHCFRPGSDGRSCVLHGGCRRRDGGGQRFGGALNLNVHVHALVLDGVFAQEGRRLGFHPASRLTRDDVAEVVARSSRSGSTCSTAQAGGRLRLPALIEHARIVERILRHVGLPTDRPEPRPARAPPRFLARRRHCVWAWRASIWNDPVRRRGSSALRAAVAKGRRPRAGSVSFQPVREALGAPHVGRAAPSS